MTEILIHWHAGRSQAEIATSLGVDRKTVKKYVSPAIAAGLAPGGAAKPPREWEALVREWFPQLDDTRLRQTTWPEIETHRDYIVAQLRAGVTKATIHQRLRDEHGLAASLASLKRFIAANLPEESMRERVTVLRDDPPPGEEAQIDYGFLGTWIDPVGGQKRRIWAFVMVLACSRHLFVRPVISMNQQVLDRGPCRGVRVLRRLCGCRYRDLEGVPARMGVHPAEECGCPGNRVCCAVSTPRASPRCRWVMRLLTTTWRSLRLGAARTRCWRRPTT
ncbi:transposase [Prauserella flavalba]|uniref:transposase n=1 Tax=Prauserella flavalba TaxID=1477506 RepID=UPI001AEF4D28|nr:transposase [Prauserella flavalba]